MLLGFKSIETAKMVLIEKAAENKVYERFQYDESIFVSLDYLRILKDIGYEFK